MKKTTKNKKKGFTLIELVVVIAILAILALILIPSITGYIAKANTAKDAANANAVYTAAQLVVAQDDTTYTDETVAGEAIKSEIFSTSNPLVSGSVDSTKAEIKVTLVSGRATIASVKYNGVAYPAAD